MLALAWQYLTGRSVATDPTDRQAAEWPPHPDRVFQAMVAAWGEGDSSGEEEAALRWLCEQGPPRIATPPAASPAAVVKAFVPVNDTRGAARGEYRDSDLALLPSRRTRKERFFPATNVGSSVCALIWPDADPADHAAALAALCAAVTHVGHSSSLVRMWLCDDPPAPNWVPSTNGYDLQLRTATPGRLDQLVRAYGDGGHAWRRAPQAAWHGYAKPLASDLHLGAFDRLVMLRQVDGPRFTLQQTPALAQALRGMLISAADSSPSALRLLSGHELDGRKLESPHVAYLPLAFVGDSASATGGAQYADGHLLGMALALPRGLDPDVEQDVFSVLAEVFTTDEVARELKMGRAGVMRLQPEDREKPPLAMRPNSWCRAATSWGTVTPIVLDRQPPRRHADHDGWAMDQLLQACMNQGLPPPVSIELLPVAPLIGAPAARSFPPLLRKDGTRRWHLHARLCFASPVRGPLLLGAGRYRGHGLCKPLTGGDLA